MSSDLNSLDSEIDLKEIAAAIWANKILISLITVLGLYFAVNHILNSQKKFTAAAIFQVEQPANRSIALPGELGNFASMAGLLGGGDTGSKSASLLERVKGREFILAFAKTSSIELDPYINTYNPDAKDPKWKAIIKKIIGWQKMEADQATMIEDGIISSFRSNFKIDKTEGGALSIFVTHANPKKASEYANMLMMKIKDVVEKEKNEFQNQRLSYLSETLADALQEMESAQQRLKEYALGNSALAQENFISGSLKLDGFRMERRKVQDIINLLLIIEKLIKSGNLADDSYEAIRSSNPLVDDIEFRRILGMSESISAWTWPRIETIEAVSETLRDRIKRLNVDIKNIEENAKIYATSAEDLAKFTRDAKIAEATYTVLIEQVKSQSLAAGFQPNNFKVYEYATPPVVPSSPKRNLSLGLGLFLGLFAGITLALLISIIRGAYYSKSSLMADLKPKLAFKSKILKTLLNRAIPKISSLISKQKIKNIDEAELHLANKKLIYVLNSGSKTNASAAARLLAVKSCHSGRKVALWDATGKSEKGIESKVTLDDSGLNFVSPMKNMEVITLSKSEPLFSSPTFNSKVKNLLSRFDQVFICSGKGNAFLGLKALEDFQPSLVLIEELRKTRRQDIKKIKENYQVELLFYD